MKRPLVLCLALAVALAVASRSPLQQSAVDLVLEDFHSRRRVQWVYKEQAVEVVTEAEDEVGHFVRLQLSLWQTQCPNKQRGQQDCTIKPKGRRQRCLACIKFDFSSPARVLDQLVYCSVELSKTSKETKEKLEEKCRAVQDAGEIYRPGIFAFSKGLSS